jgi:hypothetical protein
MKMAGSIGQVWQPPSLRLAPWPGQSTTYLNWNAPASHPAPDSLALRSGIGTRAGQEHNLERPIHVQNPMGLR